MSQQKARLRTLQENLTLQIILKKIEATKAAKLQLAHNSEVIENLKLGGRDGKDGMSTPDELAARSTYDTISERNLEQQALPIHADQASGTLDPKQILDLDDHHGPWTVEDAPISEKSSASIANLAALIATQAMPNRIRITNDGVGQHPRTPDLEGQQNTALENRHEPLMGNDATITGNPSPSMANPANRSAVGAALIGLIGEEKRKQRTEEMLSVIKQESDRARLAGLGQVIAPSRELLAFDRSGQLSTSPSKSSGIGQLIILDTYLIPVAPVHGLLLPPASPSRPSVPTSTASRRSILEVIRCEEAGCIAQFRGRYRQGDYARHKRNLHSGPVVTVCLLPYCNKVFKRRDTWLKHYREEHPELAANLEPNPRRHPAPILSSPVTNTIRTMRSHQHDLRYDMEFETAEEVIETTAPNAQLDDDRSTPDWKSWDRHISTGVAHGDAMSKESVLDYDIQVTTTEENPVEDVSLNRHQTETLQPYRSLESFEDNYDYSESESSYAASVFSVASIISPASNRSMYSNYSTQQIATATRELFDIFFKDRDLVELYRRAIDDDEIGPERLQRNLRRLLRAYANNLENEHTESLEYLASKLVAMKAAPLARAIVKNYYCTPVDGQPEACEVQDESSEDEADSQPVDEEIFGDLKAFRKFLTNAAAFETFRAQIRAFVIPKSQPVDLIEPAPSGKRSSGTTTHIVTKATANTHTWQSWRTELAEAVDLSLINRDFGLATRVASHLVFDAVSLATDQVFIAMGILEPPLSSEMVRLRWRCVGVCIRTTFKPSTNKRLKV
jgi:hypothetical protein